MFTVELEGLDELEREWTKAVNETLGRGAVYAVNAATKEGAQVAKTEHKYKTRSGANDASIRAIPAALSTSNGFDCEGEIIADSDHALFLSEGTKPHDIRPKAGSTKTNVLQQGQTHKKRGKGSKVGTPMLAWQGPGGEWHRAKVVHHPGTKPDPYMRYGGLAAALVLRAELEAACERFAEVIGRG